MCYPQEGGVNHGLKGKGGGAQRLFKLFLWVRHEPEGNGNKRKIESSRKLQKRQNREIKPLRKLLFLEFKHAKFFDQILSNFQCFSKTFWFFFALSS